jgi:cytochrome oxidase Cu insertion factor (SCO1/SenC/PrrC family)
MRLIRIVLLLSAVTVAAATGALVYSLNQGGGAGGGAAGQGGVIAVAPGVEIGGPFELVDHTGKTVTEKDFRGGYTLIYFGFTYCPDFCPTELANMARAVDLLGDDADRVMPLFFTVDPQRDTVAALADYVGFFHPRMVGLTGTLAQTDAAAREWRVFYRKVETEGATDYLVDHSTFVYLMGPDGRLRALFRYGTPPETMAAAIRAELRAAGS